MAEAVAFAVGDELDVSPTASPDADLDLVFAGLHAGRAYRASAAGGLCLKARRLTEGNSSNFSLPSEDTSARAGHVQGDDRNDEGDLVIPDLDDRLNEAAPLEHVPDLHPAIADLVEATRLTQPRRRPARRGVLISTTTASIVLAGTAAAAALGFGGWETPWGKDPDGAIAFTLPNGVECEFRIGNLQASSPGAAEELRSWLDDHTLHQITDIDATLRYLRAEENTYTRDDGTEVAVGYGTPYYDANVEYFNAVRQAISDAIVDRAEETGNFSGENASLSQAGELNCADGWEPDSAWLP